MQFLSAPERSVAVAQSMSERLEGPLVAVMAGQRGESRTAAVDLVEDAGDAALADRPPPRMGIAEPGLWNHRRPERVDGHVQPPTTALIGT